MSQFPTSMAHAQMDRLSAGWGTNGRRLKPAPHAAFVERLAGNGRRGSALIVTLWIALTVAGTAVIFARSVRVEAMVSANELAALQADAIARGALQYVISRLDGRQGVPPVETDTPCECVRLGDGAFWILRPPHEDESGFTFAIVDECGKINVNAATVDALMQLPNMTADAAAAIQDWRDPDSTVGENGAESDAYLLLSSPYTAKNAPFETVEELFLVRGMTTALMFGKDLNRNGVIDASETDASTAGLADLGSGGVDRGIWHWVTVYSAESNATASGAARANVNEGGEATNALRQALSQERAAEVIGMVRRGRPYRNMIDFYLRSGLSASEFALVADRLTVQREPVLSGLVNLCTAPREVLRCLPGLDDTDAAALIAKRASTGVDLTNLAWVADALSPEKAVMVGDVATCRSYQYSADILAVSGDGRAFKRCRAVIDTRTSPPKVVYWKDLTGLGWPLSAELRASLRQGSLKQEGAI